MTLTGQTIFIISADSAVTQECVNELTALGDHCQTQLARLIETARKEFRRTPPAVVFLDESAIDPVQGESLECAVALLTVSAPVVVAAAPDKQADLGFLIT